MQSLSRVKAQRLRELASNALAQHKYSEAIAHLNAAVWLCQGNADLYEMCAQAYVGLCDVHSALLNYRRALKLTPTDGKENACNDEQRRAEALAHLLDVRAVAMLEEGSFSLALTLLSEAVTLSPRESSFRLHRAIALSCLEQYGEALQDLDACNSSHPPSADVHYLRAKLHLMRKELSAARRAVDAAVELEPNHAASKVHQEILAMPQRRSIPNVVAPFSGTAGHHGRFLGSVCGRGDKVNAFRATRGCDVELDARHAGEPRPIGVLE